MSQAWGTGVRISTYPFVGTTHPTKDNEEKGEVEGHWVRGWGCWPLRRGCLGEQAAGGTTSAVLGALCLSGWSTEPLGDAVREADLAWSAGETRARAGEGGSESRASGSCRHVGEPGRRARRALGMTASRTGRGRGCHKSQRSKDERSRRRARGPRVPQGKEGTREARLRRRGTWSGSSVQAGWPKGSRGLYHGASAGDSCVSSFGGVGGSQTLEGMQTLCYSRNNPGAARRQGVPRAGPDAPGTSRWESRKERREKSLSPATRGRSAPAHRKPSQRREVGTCADL